MTGSKKKNGDEYYGNLPSNYLANLGKEIIKERRKNSKGESAAADAANTSEK